MMKIRSKTYFFDLSIYSVVTSTISLKNSEEISPYKCQK